MEKRDKVIDLLKNDMLSTSKIAHLLNYNYFITEDILTDLEKEKMIERFKIGNGTYWRLKDGEFKKHN